MDHAAVVSRIVEEIKNDGVADFDLDDPFDDPTLVTTAFLDIEWQDEHGNSALMLAAAENRVLHVKGILTMAISSGKLKQVVEMRNNEGMNCVQMAMRAGSETCATLIKRVSKEYSKCRPRVAMEANEEDITFELDDSKIPQEIGASSASNVAQPRLVSAHFQMRKLTREKISNSLRNAQQGRDYLQMAKRSKSAHSRLISQRTCSIESNHFEPEAPLPLPPQDHGVFSTMGERIRNIFGKKPPIHSTTLSSTNADRLPSANAAPRSSTSAADKSSPYHDTKHSEDEVIRLPQQTSEDDDFFRNAPWAHSKNALAQRGNSNSQNGVRLPPLSLRRRANSDPRNREFHSLVDDK
ncbi:unnamed protein product [Caenorhabditis bovis]|uniref:Ankyrin repeat protein n=1 Tax=Caenorhabditis bovis TaxID=2654633 RepID=A0A8S1EWS6_9PELO|nr:unnamed protein product [Caenorhabditis bovis]